MKVKVNKIQTARSLIFLGNNTYLTRSNFPKTVNIIYVVAIKNLRL